MQIGPLALILIRVALLLGESSARVLTELVASGLALVPVLVVQRLHPSRRGLHWVLAVLVGLTWSQISVHAQPADALTVAAIACGVLAAVRGRWGVAAALLFAAAGCKPWAAPIGLVLLGAPSLRVGVRLTAGYALAGAAIYLPFLLRAGSSRAIRPALVVMPDAPVAWVLDAWHRAPTGLRPVQLLACVVVAVLLAFRGHWRSIPAGVIATRLLLDPGAFPYYHAGLLAVAGLSVTRPGRLLALSAVWFALAGGLYGSAPAVGRSLQLVVGVAVLATVVRAP